MHHLPGYAEGAVCHAQAQGGNGRTDNGKLTISMRMLAAIAFVAFIVGPVSGLVVAETNRTPPIRIVVPFAAAGVQDVVTRIVFEKVSSLLGQAVIVENRPGAGGTIAMASVAAARPDGYTLVVSDPRGSLPAAPSLYPNLSYNPITSFEPIAMIGSSGAVLSVGKDFPARSLDELVEMARAKPGDLTFGSTVNGTPGHLNGEQFKRLVGIDVLYVPYRVVSQAVTDLMTARISFWISPIATVLAQLNAGQVRALASATETWLPDIANVPTIKEAGFGAFDASTAYAFFAPAGTSPQTLDILTKVVGRAMDDFDVRQRIIKAGVAPGLQPPNNVKALIRHRVTEMSELIKAAGISLQKPLGATHVGVWLVTLRRRADIALRQA